MANLSVQIDQVATLRQSRKTIYPDPVAAAVIAEMAGADGIAVHLREDRRHVQDRDLRILRKVVQSSLTLKMAATSEMLGVALNIKPDRVVLVPEKREEISIEGGLDMMVHKSTVSETVGTLQNSGIPVGILIDPDPEQLKLAHQSNANFIEVQTGTYSESTTTAKRNQAFSKIVDSVKLAHRLKIGVHLGTGLDYNNIKPFAELIEINEFYIGHSIIARALMIGLENAVKEMRMLIRGTKT
jgi:pyridoxine 5-phosphate synthase